MSLEPGPCRTLDAYLLGLIDLLRAAEPAGFARLREIIGDRRALIELDDEAVEAHFDADRLVVEEGPTGLEVHGRGGTDRSTVLSLLYGRIEVREAILGGHLRVQGPVGDIARIFHAIQLLLDASTRIPELQRLSRDFVLDPCRDGAFEPRIGAESHVHFGSGRLTAAEARALARHDLLS
jgi:hypothetical protein